MEIKKEMPEIPSQKHEHKLILNARKSLAIYGVSEVLTTSPELLSVRVGSENLLIFGKNLNVKKLVLADGLIEADGQVSEIKYTQAKVKDNRSILKRIFK